MYEIVVVNRFPSCLSCLVFLLLVSFALQGQIFCIRSCFVPLSDTLRTLALVLKSRTMRLCIAAPNRQALSVLGDCSWNYATFRTVPAVLAAVCRLCCSHGPPPRRRECRLQLLQTLVLRFHPKDRSAMVKRGGITWKNMWCETLTAVSVCGPGTRSVSSRSKRTVC